ncbi:CAP domain-containing protein, partial [Obelidium mucronatum]
NNGNTNLSPSAIDSVLEAHNTFRDQYNIGPLSWDSEIASHAIAWAVHQASFVGCVDWSHPHGDLVSLGQNLAAGTSWAYTPADLVGSWTSESVPTTPGTYNHATQVLWGATTKVGCAVAYGLQADGQTCSVLICDYSIPGNVYSQ